MKSVIYGSTNIEIVVRFLDTTNLLPLTGLTESSGGLSIGYRRTGEALTPVTPIALASLTTSHADGGFKEIANGWYRVDIPDAAFASGADEVLIYGSVTGGVMEACSVDLVSSVWDEDYADHTTAGTFGKIMDIYRKSSRVVEGQAAGTPTTTVIQTNLTGYATGTFDHELLLIMDSSEARPIESYNSTNGTITLQEPLTSAPSSGADFVIIPFHVHPISEIQAGLATNSGVTAAFTEIKGAGWSSSTDTLEKIRDAIDPVLVLVSTTIDAVTSQTVFTLTTGSSDNDAYNNAIAIITDQSTSLQKAFVRVLDYVGSTKALTLATSPQFTIAAGDSIAIVAIHPTTQAIQFPVQSGFARRVGGNRPEVYKNETVTIGPIVLTDANNDPVDLSGKTLSVVIENKATKVDVDVVTPSVSGGSNNQYSFTIDSTVTGTIGVYAFALRENADTTKLLLDEGEVIVRYAADKD